jgi:serine/threonine protein kinase
MARSKRIGRYELVSESSRSGFAVLYQGWDTLLNRAVAAKCVCGPDSSPFEALQNEARALSRLSHSNVVVMHDRVEEGGHTCLIFEWLEGQNLAQILKNSQTQPWARILPVFIDIARALDHAHLKNVVHRDVKPANIQVDPVRGAILVDFTIAYIGAEWPKAGYVVGTPRYMAPEQILGSPVTGATDVHGLGITMFEALTGTSPFGTESDITNIFNDIMSIRPDTRPLLDHEVSPQLISLIEECLAKAPEKRPTMAAVLNRLSDIASATHTAGYIPNADSKVGPEPIITYLDYTGTFLRQNASATDAAKLRVFLCHASEDKPAVRKLYQGLRRDGFMVWLDEENLLPGQDWRVEISNAVRNSDVVVVCISTHAMQKRGYIQREIREALDVADEQPEGRIYLIPVKLDPCDMPERLQRWHWVELFDNSGYERLRTALSLRASAPQSRQFPVHSGPSPEADRVCANPGSPRTC